MYYSVILFYGPVSFVYKTTQIFLFSTSKPPLKTKTHLDAFYICRPESSERGKDRKDGKDHFYPVLILPHTMACSLVRGAQRCLSSSHSKSQLMWGAEGFLQRKGGGSIKRNIWYRGSKSKNYKIVKPGIVSEQISPKQFPRYIRM